VRDMVLAWLVTLPVSALLACIAYLILARVWTSQALTDTLGVIVETWEGLWGISADRSLSD
jgi:hypothetical protein